MVFGSAAVIQNLRFDDLSTICPLQDLSFMQPNKFILNAMTGL